jgi:hypothetical protein
MPRPDCHVGPQRWAGIDCVSAYHAHPHSACAYLVTPWTLPWYESHVHARSHTPRPSRSVKTAIAAPLPHANYYNHTYRPIHGLASFAAAACLACCMHSKPQQRGPRGASTSVPLQCSVPSPDDFGNGPKSPINLSNAGSTSDSRVGRNQRQGQTLPPWTRAAPSLTSIQPQQFKAGANQAAHRQWTADGPHAFP